MLTSLAKAASDAEAAARDDGPYAADYRREAAAAAAGWQGTQLQLTVTVLDSLKRELAKERAARACAKAEAKESEGVAEQALAMLQRLREESGAMHERLQALEALKLRTEHALVRRDAELFELGRAQLAAARTLGESVAVVEEKAFAQLHRLEAKLDARARQLGGLQERVARAAQSCTDRHLDGWAQALAE